MKIAIDLTSLADNFSGIERFALSVTKELIKDKQKEYILIFKEGIHPDFQNTEKHVKCVVIKRCSKLLFQQVLLPLRLLSIKADYYLFLAFPAPFFFFSKHAISAIHDMGCWDCPESNKKHMVLYFKLLYFKAACNNKRIVTVSNFSKDRIIDILKVKPDNILVAYNGVSSRAFKGAQDCEWHEKVRKKYNLPAKYLLCLSTLEPRKNLNLLIRAFNNLVNQGFESDLVLAGRKGWMVNDLLENVSASVASRIHFTGFVDEEDLPAVYEMAQCFVFPSKYEGFGIPPLEAMAMGTLVISSNAASMPEVLGDAAFYFQSENQRQLEETIICVLKETDEVQKIKKMQGKETVKKYTWNQAASAIDSILV